MSETSRQKKAGSEPSHHSGVDNLASRALAVMAARGNLRRSPSDRSVDRLFVDRMREIAIATPRRDFGPLLVDMERARIRDDDIIDLYVPEVARGLGEMWSADEMSFASVSIGCARLHGLLRDLGPDSSADDTRDGSAPSLLLLMEFREQHTLGAAVLSGQLRRRGVSVRNAMGATPGEVTRILERIRFDAVFLSASVGDEIAALKKIVDQVRSSCDTAPQIVIGGSIMEIWSAEQLVGLTGADHATCNLDEAMNLAGLTPVKTISDEQPRKE